MWYGWIDLKFFMSRNHIFNPFCRRIHCENIKKRALPVVHLPVMKLKIHHYRSSLGSAVVHLYSAEKLAVSEIKGFSMLSGHLLYKWLDTQEIIYGFQSAGCICKYISWIHASQVSTQQNLLEQSDKQCRVDNILTTVSPFFLSFLTLALWQRLWVGPAPICIIKSVFVGHFRSMKVIIWCYA